MSEKNKSPKGRDAAREFLKANGKDPEKFLPVGGKPQPGTPESKSAGAVSDTETPKAKEVVQTDKSVQGDQNVEAQARKELETEEKRLFEVPEADLSEEEKKRKKEILILRAEEKEAKREAGIQKRFDELTGELRDLKSQKNQDKEKIALLESQLDSMRHSAENNPEKVKAEVQRREQDRIQKALEEDKRLPREQRREMTREELEDWLVEDIVSAQEWMTDRNLRRREERLEDQKNLTTDTGRKKAEDIIRSQKEVQAQVLQRHPELDISKRVKELESQGKSKQEIKKIIHSENPKVKVIAEILEEDADKYLLDPNGPESLAKEMERRLAGKPAGTKSGETQEEREERIRQEAAEAESHRTSEVDAGLTARGGAGSAVTSADAEYENRPLFKQQLEIWKKQFPGLAEKEVKSRLIKRLKHRDAIGAA